MATDSKVYLLRPSPAACGGVSNSRTAACLPQHATKLLSGEQSQLSTSLETVQQGLIEALPAGHTTLQVCASWPPHSKGCPTQTPDRIVCPTARADLLKPQTALPAPTARADLLHVHHQTDPCHEAAGATAPPGPIASPAAAASPAGRTAFQAPATLAAPQQGLSCSTHPSMAARLSAMRKFENPVKRSPAMGTHTGAASVCCSASAKQ